MLYFRGHPRDYDRWANVTGDPTWKYENVLPYFKSSMDYHGKSTDDKHYGKSGSCLPHVEHREWRPMFQQLMDAGKEMGYEIKDLNAPQTSGFEGFEVTQKNGKRYGTYFAFLKDFCGRKNLHISRYSHVTKIKLDKLNRAVGVWYVQHGVKKYARASKEIFVSGGAVDSPKILMLSGIGPKKHLQSVGIKTKADLQVGQKLQDHIAVMSLNTVMEEPISFIPERDFDLSVMADYFFRGKGIGTSPTNCLEQGFISTGEVRKTGIDWPDIQLYLFLVGIYQGLPAEFSGAFGHKQDILEKFTKTTMGKDGFILMPTLVRPNSVGEIFLRNKNPFSSLIIDPHYLEHPHDVKALVECWNLQNGISARGVADPKAVLDSKLRVMKTKGLRVADASIMVDIINGYTNAPSVMIGEKASFMIREYWSEQYLVFPILNRLFDKQWLKKCFYSKIV